MKVKPFVLEAISKPSMKINQEDNLSLKLNISLITKLPTMRAFNYQFGMELSWVEELVSVFSAMLELPQKKAYSPCLRPKSGNNF